MEKKNLEQYIEFHPDRFTKKEIFRHENCTIFVLNFQPGQSLPKHKHPDANVYIQVLSGKGVFEIASTSIQVEKNDLISCTSDEELSFLNNDTSNVSLYVVLSKEKC